MFIRLLILLLTQTTIANRVLAYDSSSVTTLRYDGVYIGKPFVGDEKYCHYLRFYPKGTVITVSTECDKRNLKSIKKWFLARKSGPLFSGNSLGIVTIKDNQISFAAVSREGTVSYKGSIVGDQLLLSSHSHINGHNDVDTYTFASW